MALFSDAEASGMWAAQLLDMAAEKKEAGDKAAARELERMAEVHQRQATGRARPTVEARQVADDHDRGRAA